MASELAKKIAAALFTNGNGDHAERLVLVTEVNGDLGGWCESAVASQVDKVLSDHESAADAKLAAVRATLKELREWEKKLENGWEDESHFAGGLFNAIERIERALEATE